MSTLVDMRYYHFYYYQLLLKHQVIYHKLLLFLSCPTYILPFIKFVVLYITIIIFMSIYKINPVLSVHFYPSYNNLYHFPYSIVDFNKFPLNLKALSLHIGINHFRFSITCNSGIVKVSAIINSSSVFLLTAYIL